ncbi:ABC transporter ATP-binding protein [Clostridium botulinum]|uniref:ABC transporter, ATP-binding transmembrane protein n=1 Tax=Clostridium botulinum (strain Hall / ATCC 3502 / NCTC 13319 / Type A) TaxID=441771 RepID=A5I447_CLOBH|nr:ABC transporter ATP-binding protein [Clostridium botulinum]ABS34391.1 ABC transporter, ATP-binding protein [Clostridium botulinum A str. ATCC 19397]ABS38564.1 ABC transporter, ATP-binding protein [Clostridium botulinum A str. Hall]AWB18144.1 ABC transporter ATP-binding protein [Clostridium botulinum]EGT5616054.1 ABC transporter ATP-binding protein [Clostridium botulinum]EGT5623469.1 ABC transporter ATP-binding protein [Clostridium botulinum]
MFKSIKRIIQWSGHRKKRLYVGFIYSFFNTMFTAMPIMGAAYGLNLIIEDMKGNKNLTINWVLYMLGFMVFTVLGRFLFSYLRASTQDSIGYEVTAEQRIRIGDILKRVSLGFFSEKNAGEIASAVTTDLSFIEMYGMKMIDVVVNGYISAFTMVFCLAFYDLWIAIIAMAGILLSAIFLKLLGDKSNKNAPIHQKAQDSMITATIEYIRGMSVVKAFKQNGVSIEGIRNAYKMSKDINIKIEKDYVPYNCLHLFVLKLASVIMVLASAIMAVNGIMDIPTMLMMSIFSFVIFGHIETINNAAHVLKIIDATLDKLNAIKSADFIDKNSKDIKLSKYDIKFKNVTFGYEKRDVLRNVSFTIPENTTTAIVGPSGSGKSTICNLIARFYDVDKGSISIGGINIKDITCDSLLKNISMVFQKVYLFHDTVYNNIRFGKPEASFEDVIKVAKKACCHDFIMNLPNGYETVIGDGGSTLSGGEKQRISIARAMLKNAPIVILDEATASVDSENEHAIQKAISALVHGKTIIIIAHRLATIENADQILVVDGGCVAQRGAHKELINQKGVYKRFLDIRKTAEEWNI